MSRFTTVVPVLAGAIAGAVVAAIIASGSSSSTVTKTVIQGSTTPAASSVPNTASVAGGNASSGSSTTAATSGGLTVNQIYRQDSPGVVDITVTAVSQSSSGFGLFGGGQQSQESEDEGAGVVYDSSGDIMTDEHVVAGATSIEVHFQNGVNAKAKLIGEDASTDVAVIKVDVPKSELHPIQFANSNSAQVGDPVTVIGSPFSLPETVTSGIVSAVGRSIEAPNQYTITGAIQTDASINPGNSGGPVLDSNGDVIGLADQIETSSGDSAGVGFATPGNADIKVADKFIAGKKVEHAWVGICLNSESTVVGAQISTTTGQNCPATVVAGGPAAKAGLQPGDTITSVNGQPIASSDGFIETIDNYKPGQTVTMHVTGPGGTRTIHVTLGNRPASAPTAG